MLEPTQTRIFSLSIFLAAMAVRLLVGIGHPALTMGGSMVIGVTTVLLLAPWLHRLVFSRQMLVSRRQQVGYVLATSVALVSFGAIMLAS